MQVSLNTTDTFLKKSRKLNTEFPLKTVHFLGVRGLISSYTVHKYNTSGHTDL